MPDPTTTNIVLAVPTRGSDSGTWDTPVNGDMIILDACAGSVTTKTLSSSNVSLSTTESQVSIIRLTGTVTSSLAISLGAVIKSWIIENLTVNSGFSVKIFGNSGTGNAIMPPPGSSQIYWDGTNVSFINLPGFIGQFVDYATDVVPLWISQCTVPPYLLCDGSTYNPATYPLLAGVIGATTLPDTRGRARYSLDGGTGRVTTGGSGVDGSNRFIGGGNQNRPILQANLPSLAFPSTLGVTGSVSLSAAAGGVLNGQGVGVGANISGGGGAYNIAAITASPSLAVSGSVTSGGSGTNLITMPPVYIGGITVIRAA